VLVRYNVSRCILRGMSANCHNFDHFLSEGLYRGQNWCAHLCIARFAAAAHSLYGQKHRLAPEARQRGRLGQMLGRWPPHELPPNPPPVTGDALVCDG